eukprot:11890608-Karenia_brevis.AAC.1
MGVPRVSRVSNGCPTGVPLVSRVSRVSHGCSTGVTGVIPSSSPLILLTDVTLGGIWALRWALGLIIPGRQFRVIPPPDSIDG